MKEYTIESLYQAIKNNNLDLIRDILESNKSNIDFIKIPDKDGKTALHIATQSRKKDAIRLLLDEIPTPEGKEDFIKIPDNDGKTALHIATQGRNNDIITILLNEIPTPEGKANLVKITDKNSKTALHIGTKYSFSTIVELLLDKTTDAEGKQNVVKVPDQDGKTVLHIAVETGREDIVTLIIDKIINTEDRENLIKVADNNGKTVLHLAVEMSREDIVRRVINKITTLEGKEDFVTISDKEGKTALHIASKSGNENIVEELINTITTPKGKEDFIKIPDKEGKTALHIASKFRNKNIVEQLINTITTPQGKEDFVIMPDKKGQTALHIAHDKRIINLLTNTITNPKEKERFVKMTNINRLNFNKAIQDNDCDLISDVLKFDVLKFDLQRYQDFSLITALHIAAQHGSKDIVELLMNQIPTPESKQNVIKTSNKDDETALHIAARYGHEGIAALLINTFENPKDKKDFVLMTSLDDKTALHIAAQYGHEGIAAILINTFKNQKDKENFVLMTLENDKTALHLAAQNGHEGVATLLIGTIQNQQEKEAFVKSNDFRNCTALHHAALNGNKAIATLLIGTIQNQQEKEKFVKSNDFSNCTALHYAASEDVAKILIETIKNQEDKKTYMNVAADGETALYNALKNANTSIAKYLLSLKDERGILLCNVNILPPENRELMKFAKKRNLMAFCQDNTPDNIEIRQMLREAGAVELDSAIESQYINDNLAIEAVSTTIRNMREIAKSPVILNKVGSEIIVTNESERQEFINSHLPNFLSGIEAEYKDWKRFIRDLELQHMRNQKNYKTDTEKNLAEQEYKKKQSTNFKEAYNDIHDVIKTKTCVAPHCSYEELYALIAAIADVKRLDQKQKSDLYKAVLSVQTSMDLSGLFKAINTIFNLGEGVIVSAETIIAEKMKKNTEIERGIHGIIKAELLSQLTQGLLESVVFNHTDIIPDITHLRMPIVKKDNYKDDKPYYEYIKEELSFRKIKYTLLRGLLKEEFFKNFDEYQKKYIPDFINQNAASAEDLQKFIFRIIDYITSVEHSLVMSDNIYLDVVSRLKNSKCSAIIEKELAKTLFFNYDFSKPEVETDKDRNELAIIHSLKNLDQDDLSRDRCLELMKNDDFGQRILGLKEIIKTEIAIIISEEQSRFSSAHRAINQFIENEDGISILRKMQLRSVVDILMELLQDPKQGRLNDNQINNIIGDKLTLTIPEDEEFKIKLTHLAQDLFKNRSIPEVREIHNHYIMKFKNDRAHAL